jgi:hypothetical protein
MLRRRATRLIERRKVTRARRLLARAMKLRDDWRVRRLLAICAEREGQPLAAADQLEKGAYHAPPKRKSQLHDRRGQLLLKLGKRDAACVAFRAAVKAWPRNLESRKRVALLCR